MGHDVTLFASGDSTTAAEVVSCASMALRLDPNVKEPIPYYMLMIDRVRRMADDFDVLHFHIDNFQFPMFRHMAGRTVTTLHGRQDIPDLKMLYNAFPDMPLVSISDAQRRPVPSANFAATVYHGLPNDLHRANLGPTGDYVAFLGRISRPRNAPTAPSASPGRPAFRSRSRPRSTRRTRSISASRSSRCSNEPGVEYIGEINERSKSAFLGNARALLFPIDWPEPFGLVMIEAMACGTPVLAFRNGSVPEVIEDGLSGYLVDTEEEAISVLPQTLMLDRRRVRRRFEERFSASRMAADYVAVYEKLLERSLGTGLANRHSPDAGYGVSGAAGQIIELIGAP